ncbi:MAG: glycoside hydrolase family 28 protein [Pyrinomonadaceae bacterium]
MKGEEHTFVSRRKWLGQMSGPAVAASVGAFLPAASADAAPVEGDSAGARVYDVRAFGAKGDGATLDTAAVQAAIDACHKERGGVVLVPAGDFVVGTLELKSNITLHLAAQGRLLGSSRPEHYRAGNGVPPGNGNIVLISAADAENISIEGPGSIDGNGAAFFNGRGDNTGPGQNSSEGYFRRPHLLVFYRCKNLLVRDVFLTKSAYHCMRVLQCERVRLEGVRIHNRVNKNNDGFHIQSCRYVHISNCDVACQDDACALFGSNKFVTVTNCTFSTRWSVFRFGGGEAENITVSNCVVYETYGCPVKMRCGARSRFENITFSNLVLKDVTGPISIGLDSASRRRADDATPVVKGVVRNITFNGIRASVVAVGRQHADLPFKSEYRPGETRSCIVLNGAGDEFLEGISFQDVHVTYEGGGTPEEAAREVPQMAGEYFETGTPPAYGLYARGVRGLTLNNVRLGVTTPDRRPAVVFERVSDVSVNGLAADGDPGAPALVRFADTRDVLLTASRLLTPAAVFLRVEGATSEGITVDGGDISKAAAPLSYGRGATAKAVKLRV